MVLLPSAMYPPLFHTQPVKKQLCVCIHDPWTDDEPPSNTHTHTDVDSGCESGWWIMSDGVCAGTAVVALKQAARFVAAAPPVDPPETEESRHNQRRSSSSLSQSRPTSHSPSSLPPQLSVCLLCSWTSDRDLSTKANFHFWPPNIQKMKLNFLPDLFFYIKGVTFLKLNFICIKCYRNFLCTRHTGNYGN